MKATILKTLISLLLILPSLLAVSLFSQAAEARILVSNKPLALIAAATYPADQIDILVPDGMSPHDYSLRPSDIIRIRQADKVLWAGDHVEPYLAKFAKQKSKTEWLDATELMQTLGLYGSDPHVWLSPELAIAISERITAWNPISLEQATKDHQAFANTLNKLVTSSKTQLAPLKHSGFFVFHQAYDYWFQAIDIKQLGAFTLSPERKPGARHVQKMRNQLQNKEVRCVLSEPQFSPALIDTVVNGLTIHRGELDPLAGKSVLTKTAYIDWLSDMTKTLAECLK
ncbi:MAG: zinc ABC transporter substrate-binding protein [Oleispira antarctica]|uniref:High-affinity zinc uptake system protein ZnuA n=1 Tax=Oleispira antarctica RB-8 TaxID=698738 RepID=R4YJH6_OLEAN|nr:zinc ABC transporter substrate-binding protein [Oleispira antarctica]CCK74215.1 High-affinity zinc uptake system protein [Oleispira antarctica RB-8]